MDSSLLPLSPDRIITNNIYNNANINQRTSLAYGMNMNGGNKRFENVDMTISHRSSIILPHLEENEKKFFELVHAGDVEDVKRFLTNTPIFNINCVNFQGVSALLIAIQSKNEHMAEFLLNKPEIEVGDAALHAVRDNQIEILQMILERFQKTAPSLEFVGVTHSSNFPDYMTPLILAAQCGHYEIIEMLIQRGHIIDKPHSPKCRCPDCKIHLERDDLLHAETLRINLYKAVTNPAFICHSTHDPILTAFELSWELRQCSFSVPEFRTTYAELADEISAFAVDLIACCRSTTEMEIILKQTEGLPRSFYLYPRLVLAHDLKQKLFVTHPNTQQLVESAWQGNWHEYKLKPTYWKIFCFIYRIPMLPIIAFMCTFMPKSSRVLHYKIPLNKMISHNAGYLVFLIIIFLESNMDKTGQKRKPPDSGLEPIIVVFVIGYASNCLRMSMSHGPSRYFKSLWNWHAVVTNFLFVLTFVFWIFAYVDGIKNGLTDLERKYWHHLDPILIAEGTFAAATLMSYFRLMYYCRLNYYMGPLQISLGKMCADMAKYLTLFVIIIISFSAAMCRFYNYYDGMVQIDSNNIKTQQVSSYISFAKTLKTFFWALFCMAPLETADVVIQNLPGPTPNTTITNSHDFTEAVGYIAFAVYEVLTVIMILNMLIATMSATFQRVIDNLDTEWTFGKTDFYLEYMMQSTLPPPLNLIPVRLGFDVDFSGSINYGNTPEAIKQNTLKMVTAYQALISELVQRYFRERDTMTTVNELDELRQEINELKLEIKDLIDIANNQ